MNDRLVHMTGPAEGVYRINDVVGGEVWRTELTRERQEEEREWLRLSKGRGCWRLYKERCGGLRRRLEDGADKGKG
jgi:hypothetical protein